MKKEIDLPAWSLNGAEGMTASTLPSPNEIPTSRIIPLDRWTREIDKTPATIWRWRKLGLIEVQNIAGRLYISRDEIARFEARVAAGEFAKVHKTPARREGDQ